jgi:hypothetical protein
VEYPPGSRVTQAFQRFDWPGGGNTPSETASHWGVEEAWPSMTTKQGRPTWEAKRATGIANGVEANERRREPRIVDWDKAIANLRDILDDDQPDRSAGTLE